jgi:pimeloyl-ACP methyl ester carboxylesterase
VELLMERDDKAAARRDAEELAEALRQDPIATWKELIAHWPAAERELIESKPDVIVEDSREATTHGGLGYFLDDMSSWQPWPEEFDRLELPVHVFHARGDQWAPIDITRVALAAIPDVRWTIYDGDHLAPFATRERQAAMLDLAC